MGNAAAKGIMTMGLALLLCSCTSAPVVNAKASATAQPLAVAESYDYECDTPPGHIADWVRTLSGSQVTVRGSILVKEGRQHPVAPPVANALLAGTEVAQTFGLRAEIPSLTPELLQIELVGPYPDKAVIPVATVPWKNEPVDFELSLNGAGEVELTAGGHRSALHIGAVSLTKFSLGCSTADVHFSHVTVLPQ